MFKDYYDILGIKPDASKSEIKKAFREQAKKWHPDKSDRENAEDRMKDINEAYIILKDAEARSRYDKEYDKFKGSDLYRESEKQSGGGYEGSSFESCKKGNETYSYRYKGYKVSDETLEEWIQNAKRQAVELAKKSLKEFGEVSYEAAKEGAKGAAFQIASQVGCLIFIVLVVLISTFFFT